jgi:hypothetical protein
MTHAGAEKKAQRRPFPAARASGTKFVSTNISQYYHATGNRNPVADCIVFSLVIAPTREKNDAPETDFHRRFPHEPIPKQAEEAAGQTLPRAGQAVLNRSA